MIRCRRFCIAIIFLTVLIIAFPIIWRTALRSQYDRKIYETNNAPDQETAVVFGAAVLRNGRLSSVLRDRVETAVQLYKNGQVDKILVSGHQTDSGYDEPGAMMSYAVQRGVRPEDIRADYAGSRTYDTCFRAKSIFELDSVTLVSQEFHLPRALFTCDRLGLDVIGVAADGRIYRGAKWYEMRELFASVVALLDVITGQEPAILGTPSLFR